jgi:flavin-dependent dehydrogenase
VPSKQYDVAILGGGLAGLTLSIQLKRARPETSIFVAEKREGPAPEAAFKVGESTVEMSAYYFAEVVGMKDHLDADELPKAGLRFFFPAGDNSDITERVEWGPVRIPPIPSYQVDRGRFENALGERALELGVDLVGGCKVEDVDLGEPHVVKVTRDEQPDEVEARWVVDATGWVGLLKRKLGLEKDVAHTINSAWFRLAGGLDIEDWSDDEDWIGRMDAPGTRKLSTNHLMGEGYWVWLIPLSSGPISIGIVADPRFHPFEEINTIEAAIEWLKRHERQLGDEIDRRRDQVEDFLKVEDFAYSCQRVFSPDRWALTGVAGVFADPFYSPGSDYIAEGNTYITDMVVRDLSGEDVRRRALSFNAAYLGRFDTAIEYTYTNQYEAWGNAQVMTAKLLWEFAAYWATVVMPFNNGQMTNLDYPKLVSDETNDRIYPMTGRIQKLFLDWNALGQREWRNAFISNSSFDGFWQMHEDLHLPLDAEGIKEKLAVDAEILEAMAVVIFHKALEMLPDHSIDADTKVNPTAISLHPDRWERDGLFRGDGLSLSEARSRVPGIENMLLDEVVQPV